jgi:hypothetical protein
MNKLLLALALLVPALAHAVDFCNMVKEDAAYHAIHGFDPLTEASDMKNHTFRVEQCRLSKLPGASIGMSAKTVAEKSSWGKPDKINRMTTARGTSEQWVYDNGGYLYFTNGVLTAVQN